MTPKDVLVMFDTGYLERFSVRAPISKGKDAKLAQQLLERYDGAQLQDWIHEFFLMRDAFIQQSGYTFGVFAACLGKVIVSNQAKQTVEQKADTYRQFQEEMRLSRERGQSEERRQQVREDLARAWKARGR